MKFSLILWKWRETKFQQKFPSRKRWVSLGWVLLNKWIYWFIFVWLIKKKKIEKEGQRRVLSWGCTVRRGQYWFFDYPCNLSLPTITRHRYIIKITLKPFQTNYLMYLNFKQRDKSPSPVEQNSLPRFGSDGLIIKISLDYSLSSLLQHRH